jgi:hypothetical protein
MVGRVAELVVMSARDHYRFGPTTTAAQYLD